MIITCPSCSARYKVKDDLIQDKGKKVKCRKCETVFRVFPDGESKVIQGSPSDQSMPAAPPKPAAPPTPAAPKKDDPAIQTAATVMIDTKKIKEFAQNAAGQGHTMPPAPAKPFDPDAQNGIQATVKVDRTQLESFLQQKQESLVPPGGSESTLAVSREDLDRMLKQQQAGGGSPISPTLSEPSPTPSFDDSDADDQADFSYGATESDSSDDDLSDSFNFDAPSPEPTSEEPVSRAEGGDTFDFGDLDQPSQGEDDAFNFDQPPPSESAPLETPFSTPVDVHSPQEPGGFSASSGDQLFRVVVDGTEYPNLTLDILERWIKEGRLLESDPITREGEDNFIPAEQREELVPIFQRYFGEGGRIEEPKKKGFFARLFGK